MFFFCTQTQNSTETNFKGSSNSQDSFPAPGSAGASLDGYGGYPGGYPAGPGGYNERPPSQSNAQAGPHPGKSPEQHRAQH